MAGSGNGWGWGVQVGGSGQEAGCVDGGVEDLCSWIMTGPHVGWDE